MNWIEIVGYCASVIVAVSLTMTNIKRLRWFNLVGCMLFSIYGLIVKAYPVFAVNGFIAIVNVYYLYRMYQFKDNYSTLRVELDDKFLANFVSFWKSDIEKFFPAYKIEKTDHIFFIIRNSLPVGLFVSRQKNPSESHIVLDYAVPDYRDMGNSKFFFKQHVETLRLCKVVKLVAVSDMPDHISYLKQLGFSNIDKDRYEYSL